MKNSRTILSENLALLMAHNKMGQMELSRRSKVAQATIGRILRSESAATVDVLDDISKVFGLHTWQLFVETLDPSNPPVLRELNEKEREFYERIKQAAKDLASYQ